MGKNSKHSKRGDFPEHIPVAVIESSTRSVYSANGVACRMFSLKRKTFPIPLSDFLGDELARQLRRILKMKKNPAGTMRTRDKLIDVAVRRSSHNSNRYEIYLTDLTHLLQKIESEKKATGVFRTIVENSEDGISVVDGDRFVFVNKKFLDLFGYTDAKQLIGKPITIVVAPEDCDRVVSNSKARQHGQNIPIVYEYKGKRRSGEIIDIEVAASKIEFNGKPASLSFHRDITDRNLLEKQLVESEQFRENVFASIEHGVAVFDQNLRCLDWNHQMHSFTGFERSEVLGLHAYDIFDKFKEYGALEKFRNVLTGTKISFGYLPYRHPLTKQMRYAWLNLSPLLDVHAEVRGVVAVLSDLTHQKFMQDEIKESETLFRNVLEAMGDALVLTDLQGRVLRVNKEFERITGYSEDEAVGQTIPYSWFYEPDTSRFVVWISELRNKNYLHDFDIRWKSKSNQIIPVSLNTTLLRNKEGEPVAMLNIARDITDRKKLEVELQNRTKQIELINRVISKANETIEISDLLDTLDRELRQILRFDRLGIALIRGINDVEEVTFTADKNAQTIRREVLKGSGISLGFDIRQWGKTFVSNNLSRESFEIANLPLVREGYQSLVTVPIYTKDTFHGLLYIAAHERSKFLGDEVALLQPICEQIGLIVDKLNLFAQVRGDAQYIHNLLDSMDDIVFTVNNELIITETNTPIEKFPFLRRSKLHRTHKHIIGQPLYKIITQAPYRHGIDKVIDALFSENISIYISEFTHRHNGEERSYQLRINPMKVEGKIVGLVFTHTDITRLKQTEEELKRRNRDLIELNEISAMLTMSLSLDEVYKISLGKILKMFHASLVTVYLIKGDSIQLSGYAGKLTRNELREIQQIDLHKSLVGKVLRTKEPVFITQNMEDDPSVSEQWMKLIRNHNLKATVAIPLVVQQKILGAINIDFNHPRELTGQEIQLLKLLSNQLSAAIENIRLYENLHARMNDLTILASLGNIYASSLDINELSRNVLDHLKNLRKPDVLSIALLDKAGQKLRLIASHGVPETMRSHSYEAHHPALLRLLDTRSDTIIEDVENQLPELYEILVRKDQKSIGYFVLQTESEVLGLLSVGFTRSKTFYPEDVALYRSIAAQLSMAIQNAQLYQKIQDSEEKYRLLVEAARDMVISMDLDGTFTYVSPSSVHITGYSPEEILNQKFSPRMIHPDDYRYITKLMRLAAERRMSTETIRALEFRIRTKQGSYRWMSASWTLVHDAHENVTGVQCFLHDVHERRLAEEEITQQLQRQRVLYELTHQLAATLDRDKILHAVAKSINRILPYQSFSVLMYNDEIPDVVEQIYFIQKNGLEEGNSQHVVLSLTDPSRELERSVIRDRQLHEREGRWHEPYKIVAPMIMEEKILGLVVLEAQRADRYSEVQKNLLQTIAHQAGIAIEKALLYEETIRKSEEIERRNRELDSFTYVVSHDLKEPLISIEGYSKILLADYRDKLSEDGEELLLSITQSCTRMKNLINELLTLSRVGRQTDSMTTVDIGDVLREILNDIDYTIKKRNVRIELPDELPKVRGNRVHLVILFRNLLVNGIKFNTSDQPVLSVDWCEDDHMYRFSVRDNGIGIEKEYFDKIFVIFHRLRSNAGYEGTGAGLTIVKKIVETHGGTIWLDSEVGKGTTFYFTLPKP